MFASTPTQQLRCLKSDSQSNSPSGRVSNLHVDMATPTKDELIELRLRSLSSQREPTGTAIPSLSPKKQVRIVETSLKVAHTADQHEPYMAVGTQYKNFESNEELPTYLHYK